VKKLPSVLRRGLGGAPETEKNFECSADGGYLATDPMLALGFLLAKALMGPFTDKTHRRTMPIPYPLSLSAGFESTCKGWMFDQNRPNLPVENDVGVLCCL
jgi:hypothetical protein